MATLKHDMHKVHEGGHGNRTLIFVPKTRSRGTHPDAAAADLREARRGRLVVRGA